MRSAIARPIPILALLLAAGCGRSPVSPSPTPGALVPALARSVTGSWTGTYVPVCPSSPTCSSIGGAPSGPQPFALTLRQDGETLTGQINLSGWLPRVADVTGTISAAGVMTLQGGDSWSKDDFCRPAGGWNIQGWNGRFDAQSSTIAGDFVFVTQKHLNSCYYEQNLQVNATTMALRPGNPPDAALAGHWQGSSAILKCVPVGWTSCTPQPNSSEVPLDVRLTQNGTVVSGTIARLPFSSGTPLPVNGTASANGSTLELSGSLSEVASSSTHIVRLTSWSVTIDAIGRMQGRFSYVDEVRWSGGPNAGSTWSTTYEAELRHVVRVPW
jgi:hypothetical protein